MFSALDAKGYLPSPLSEPALTRLADLLRALLARHHGGTSPFRPDGGPAGNGTAAEVSCAPVRKPKLLKRRDLLGSFGLQRPASSLIVPRSGSFGFRCARVRLIPGAPFGSFGRSGSFGFPRRLGFVWCERLRRSLPRNLAPATELASARAERPFAAHDHPQIRGKTPISLHDHRNFRQPRSCHRQRSPRLP